MIKVVTPLETYFPHRIDEFSFNDDKAISIFLAGTIDDGSSVNWQDQLIEKLLFYNFDENDDRDFDEDFSIGDLIIYNPRREYWPANTHKEEIKKQIKWEQEHLENADIIIMNILPDSKSPISLLELGLYGPEGKMLVFCTEDFYRFSNVKLTCERYNIPLIQTNDNDKIANTIEYIYDELKEDC